MEHIYNNDLNLMCTCGHNIFTTARDRMKFSNGQIGAICCFLSSGETPMDIACEEAEDEDYNILDDEGKQDCKLKMEAYLK